MKIAPNVAQVSELYGSETEFQMDSQNKALTQMRSSRSGVAFDVAANVAFRRSTIA